MVTKFQPQSTRRRPLHPSWETKCVQMRSGKKVLTDGPFAKAREQLVGYFLIDARDSDEAIEIATRIPGAQFGTVEVRQVMEVDGLPDRGSIAVVN